MMLSNQSMAAKSANVSMLIELIFAAGIHLSNELELHNIRTLVGAPPSRRE